MTAPKAPVRVRRKPTVFGTDGSVVFRTWCAHCTGCGDVVSYGWTRPGDAADGGRRHAATCAALRFAALVKELETLRDRWSAIRDHQRDQTWQVGDPHYIYAESFGQVASDLAAVLARVAGGAG